MDGDFPPGEIPDFGGVACKGCIQFFVARGHVSCEVTPTRLIL